MRIKNLPSISSMDGSQDALVIEQTDGSEDKSRKVSPAQIKQYVLGNSIDDIYSVMGQMGAKNLIIYPYRDPSGRINRGITFTYDKDGIITANGSTNANDQAFITLDDFSWGLVLSSTKKYTLTCEKTNDNNKGFAVLYFRNADNTAKTVSMHAVYEDGTTRNANSDYVSLLFNNVFHTSVTFWIDTDTNYTSQVRININSGTITNAVIKPMLRLASDTDDTYQPYAKTNKELTEQIAEMAKTLYVNSSSFDIASKLSGGESAAVVVSDSDLCIAFAGDTNSLSGVVSRLASNVYAWFLVTYNYKFIYVRTDASFTVSRRFYAAGTSF